MMDKFGNAIASIESGGRYDLLGPVIKNGRYAGSRAYGKYQIMDFNIPQWTQAALGRPYTPQEFLKDPQAQEATFKHQFGKYAAQYGPEEAAGAWFAGPGGRNNMNARDQLGTSVANYRRRFSQHLGGDASAAPASPVAAAMGYAPEEQPSGVVAKAMNAIPVSAAQGYAASAANGPAAAAPVQVAQAAPAFFGGPQVLMEGKKPDIGHGIGKALVNMGAALSSANQPAQAAALARIAEGMGDDDVYTTHFNPTNGMMLKVNKKTGQVVGQQIAPAAPKEDAYTREANKSWAERNASIMDTASKAKEQLEQAEKAMTYIEDPNVPQGAAGEARLDFWNWVKTMSGANVAGVDEGQRLRAFFKEVALTFRNPAGGAGMPGSLSNDDRKYLEQIAGGLNNQRGANREAVEAFIKVQQRRVQLEDWRREYVAARGRLDEGFQSFVERKAIENPLFPKSAPAAAPAEMSASKRGASGGFKILGVEK